MENSTSDCESFQSDCTERERSVHRSAREYSSLWPNIWLSRPIESWNSEFATSLSFLGTASRPRSAHGTGTEASLVGITRFPDASPNIWEYAPRHDPLTRCTRYNYSIAVCDLSDSRRTIATSLYQALYYTTSSLARAYYNSRRITAAALSRVLYLNCETTHPCML